VTLLPQADAAAAAVGGNGSSDTLPPLYAQNRVPHLLRFGIIREFAVDASTGHWRVLVDQLVLVDAEAAGAPGATVLRPVNESFTCNVSKIVARSMYVNVQEANGMRCCDAATVPWENRVLVVDTSEDVNEAEVCTNRDPAGVNAPAGSAAKRQRRSLHKG
jgi:hypothetical protein